MFKTHLIQKSGDLRTLPRGSKEPEKETRNISKEIQRIPLAKKPVGPGGQMENPKPEMRQADPWEKKNREMKSLDKAVTAGSSPSTGSNMMHTAADGGIKKDIRFVDADKDDKKTFADHRKEESAETPNKKKGGFEKSLSHAGRQWSQKPGQASVGNSIHTLRENDRKMGKILAEKEHGDAMAGMRNLHKAMCPVVKGLMRMVKAFSRPGRAITAYRDTKAGRPITSQAFHDTMKRPMPNEKKK